MVGGERLAIDDRTCNWRVVVKRSAGKAETVAG